MGSEIVQKAMDLKDLKPIKTQSIDLYQFDKKEIKIEKVEIIQVPSSFTPKKKDSNEYIPQWVLRVSSNVITTLGEGEEKIEFRASELFNLVQDNEGNLKGYPEGEKSNLMIFMKDIKAKNPDELIGKMALTKVYDKEIEIEGRKTKRTYIKFRY